MNEYFSRVDAAALNIALATTFYENWLTRWNGEFGDDPATVADFASLASVLRVETRGISGEFDLQKASLARVNVYFTLDRTVRALTEKIMEIEESEFGSRKNTRAVIGCMDQVRIQAFTLYEQSHLLK